MGRQIVCCAKGVAFSRSRGILGSEKETGKEYDNIGYFKDTGENGSPWEHKTPEIDEEYTTINEQAIVSLCLLYTSDAADEL